MCMIFVRACIKSCICSKERPTFYEFLNIWKTCWWKCCGRASVFHPFCDIIFFPTSFFWPVQFHGTQNTLVWQRIFQLWWSIWEYWTTGSVVQSTDSGVSWAFRSSWAKIKHITKYFSFWSETSNIDPTWFVLTHIKEKPSTLLAFQPSWAKIKHINKDFRFDH